jgi:hypothetical protein
MDSMFPHTPKSLKARREYLERIAWRQGRPDRQTVINSEDCINLAIALHKTNDVTDFIRSI